MAEAAQLLPELKRFWGYDSFRPLQERIIRSIVDGHDVAVVMPTGGGKSLCYQLPAVVSGRTAIVVSPLISLMQDQAVQLAQMGIPAGVLNSSMEPGRRSEVMRDAIQGAFRLLYLSPERLARPDTFSWLERVPVGFFAIDEAHCISEWGHEFRPDYRQLSRLRQRFPHLPIAAFTASATRRVRHDILDQLGLRDPHKYIASFHRPNLRYIVKECEGQSQDKLLLRALEAHSGANIIVYAPTIACVEETVDFLGDHGIPAVPYHGQMENAVRHRNQERWMSDETRVLVGTLAFGLGINKPSVRAVIHLAMPKSIEQYYQEAGRAGRDGQPADCVLLWRKKDSGLLAYFCDQIADKEERQRAWERYHAVRGFAESSRCRHSQICWHFGEKPRWENCGMCDVCSGMPEWVAAPSFWRKRRRNSAPLLPASSPQPSAPAPQSAPPQLPAPDSELLEFLRAWRRDLAQQTRVPAFLILTDATLLDLCAKRPSTVEQLPLVSGIGARKAQTLGPAILDALRRFASGERAKAPEPTSETLSSAGETVRLLDQGFSPEQIAAARGRQLATVVGVISNLVEQGKYPFRPEWIRPELLSPLESAARELGHARLKPLKERVPGATYDEIRLVVAKLRRESPPA